MSTNYRVTTAQQFFDIHNPPSNQQSLIDQLGKGLKKSLDFVWNYLKTIDVKNALPLIKPHNNQPNSKPLLINQNDSLIQNKRSLIDAQLLKSNKRVNEVANNNEKNHNNKKQRLKQKKQSKKIISFARYQQQEQQKLNNSFIRKNIQTKKTLNKSLISQQQNSINQNNTSTLNIKSNIQITNHNQSFNNQNQSILNISDIDSQCNFNILNNQDVFQEKDKGQGGVISQGFQYDQIQHGETQNNIPQLELTQYPFLRPGKKWHINKNKYNKNHPNNNKTTNKFITKQTQPLQLNQPLQIIQPLQFNYQSQYFDVDNSQFPHKSVKNNYKRNASPGLKFIQSQIRKQFQYNQSINHHYKPNDKRKNQRYQMFDRLIQSRYQKLVQQSLISGQKSQGMNRQQSSLKEDYQQFIEKNFGAMKYLRKRLQNNKVNKSKQSQTKTTENQKQKFSQILKPVDTSPAIQRKKLYTFTRQCESKISVCDELRKSVTQDKEKQLIEQFKRKQQQQAIRRKQQQERIRQQQQQKRKLQQQERIRKQKQEESIRVAQQLKYQQQQKQQQKALQTSQLQKDQSQVKQLNVSKQLSESQNNKKSPEQTKPQETQSKQGKQIKQFSLFAPTSGSLFSSLKPKEPTPTQLNSKTSQDEQKKENQTLNIKKSSSIVDSDKNNKSDQKSAQISQFINKKQVSPEAQKQKAQIIVNPFLAPTKPPQMTKLQQIVNSRKDDNNLFKTIITTPIAPASPVRQPSQTNPNSYLSPVHNTSHHSILDSSMCQQSQSNINATGSQVIPNQNLNGSFLNNSFTSNQNSGLFQTSASNSIYNTSTPSFNQPYNPMNGGLFGNNQQKPGLFNNQSNMFTSTQPITSAQQAVKQIPSFMQNNPTPILGMSSLPGIGQNAASLFSQRSPSKNQPQSLFAPQPPSNIDKRAPRQKRSKQERIR